MLGGPEESKDSKLGKMSSHYSGQRLAPILEYIYLFFAAEMSLQRETRALSVPLAFNSKAISFVVSVTRLMLCIFLKRNYVGFGNAIKTKYTGKGQ